MNIIKCHGHGQSGQVPRAEVLGLGQGDLGKRARFHLVTGIDMEGVLDGVQPDPDWPLILIRDNDTITYLVADHVAGYTLYPDDPALSVERLVDEVHALITAMAPCDCPDCVVPKGAVA